MSKRSLREIVQQGQSDGNRPDSQTNLEPTITPTLREFLDKRRESLSKENINRSGTPFSLTEGSPAAIDPSLYAPYMTVAGGDLALMNKVRAANVSTGESLYNFAHRFLIGHREFL